MKIKISPYQSEWPQLFEEEKQNLIRHLGFDFLEIEHIGSTSVKGLSAKPIIDILVGVKNEEHLNLLRQKLEGKENYIYFQKWESMMPYRRLFVKMGTVPEKYKNQIPTILKEEEEQSDAITEYRKYHIHCVCFSHPFFERHTLFRDHLRENKDVLKKYEDLKIKLSQQEWKRSSDYSVAKTDFITGVMDSLNYSFDPFPILETERLTLRRIEQLDQEKLWGLRIDPIAQKYIYHKKTPTLSDIQQKIEKLIEGINKNEFIFWTITKKDSDDLIGTICLWNFTPGKTKAEIGFELSPQYHKQGLMQEAIDKVIKFAFEELPLLYIEAYTHPKNNPALRLLEKNGFIWKKNIDENSNILSVLVKTK